MCLGIPAQLVAGETGHPDLVMAEVGGVPRTVNVGLLDERPGPGDWILVHMGFALNVMTPEEAADALDALGAEREAEYREAAGRDAAAAGRDAAAAGRDAAGREAEALHAAMDAAVPEAVARWMS
jgi:hydrogenase expression/formation protein HypC